MGACCCTNQGEELKYNLNTKKGRRPSDGPAVIEDKALPVIKSNSKIEITLLSTEKQGHGVKKTQAYETNLNENDLERWR